MDLIEEMLGTYVWFSPLGARNQAAPQKMTVTMRPMMGAQLRYVSGLKAGELEVRGTDPFAIADGGVVC